MSRKDDIEKLLVKHNQNLQKLKEQQASFGLYTPPHILIEIENIEVEIEKLERERTEINTRVINKLEQAIIAIRESEQLAKKLKKLNTKGKQLLQEVLEEDPQNENAWKWLSAADSSYENRRKCMQELLKIDPNNEVAKRGMEILQEFAKQEQKHQSVGETSQAGITGLGQGMLDRLGLLYGANPGLLRERKPGLITKRKILYEEVDIPINDDFANFNSQKQNKIISELAKILGTSPDEMENLGAREGSVILRLKMPKEAAERLLDLMKVNDSRLQALGIQQISQASEQSHQQQYPTNFQRSTLRFEKGVENKGIEQKSDPKYIPPRVDPGSKKGKDLDDEIKKNLGRYKDDKKDFNTM